MRKTDFYELTVALWPRAIAAGLRPVATKGFEEGEQYYREDQLFFGSPPTRADWWELCRQTPWMFCFEKHRELIDASPWPLILPGFKAASVDLKDAQGREVGRIEVDRGWCYGNLPYSIPFFGVEVRDRIMRGFRGETRARMEQWLPRLQNEYLIVEEAMRRAKVKGVDVTEDLYVKVGKEFVRKLCQGPKPTAETAVV